MRIRWVRPAASISALAVALALAPLTPAVTATADSEALVTEKLKFKTLPGNYHSKRFRVKVRNPDFRYYDYNVYVLKQGRKTIGAGEIKFSRSFNLTPGRYVIRHRAVAVPDSWRYVSDFDDGKCSLTTVSAEPSDFNFTVVVRIVCQDWDGIWSGEVRYRGSPKPYLTLADVAYYQVYLDPETFQIFQGQWVVQRFTVTAKNAPWPTFGEFKAIRIGMTFDQVKRIVGSAGRLESKGTGFQTRIYWDDMAVTFFGGRVETKVWFPG